MADDVFEGIKRHHFGVLYADPPWRFKTWNNATSIKRRGPTSGTNTSASVHYNTMSAEDISALPVSDLAAQDACLFLWICWPMMPEALALISAWGFEYKTCAFSWTKAHAGQIDMFRDDMDGQLGMGYWTRANNEVCLLATRGNPKRLKADVRQAIIEPRREHSRKPSCVYNRIERLVAGPYLELFSRTSRQGWTVWGNQVGKFDEVCV